MMDGGDGFECEVHASFPLSVALFLACPAVLSFLVASTTACCLSAVVVHAILVKVEGSQRGVAISPSSSTAWDGLEWLIALGRVHVLSYPLPNMSIAGEDGMPRRWPVDEGSQPRFCHEALSFMVERWAGQEECKRAGFCRE